MKRKSKNKIVILLTGTIVPNISEVLFLNDPEERKKQYIEAINFYLEKTNFDMVFAENSGTSLADYFKGESRIEFLTFISPLVIPDKGKSLKELEIIDHCFKNSKLITEASAVLKITGRLKILNIYQITKLIRKQEWMNQRAIICNIYKKLKMDSRCFFFTPDFWPVLKKKGEEISHPYSFERVLWKAVFEYINTHKGNFNQFNQPLRIRGINGGFGTEYKHGKLYSLAKQISHFFMPWIYSRYFLMKKS